MNRYGFCVNFFPINLNTPNWPQTWATRTDDRAHVRYETYKSESGCAGVVLKALKQQSDKPIITGTVFIGLQQLAHCIHNNNVAAHDGAFLIVEIQRDSVFLTPPSFATRRAVSEPPSPKKRTRLVCLELFTPSVRVRDQRYFGFRRYIWYHRCFTDGRSVLKSRFPVIRV